MLCRQAQKLSGSREGGEGEADRGGSLELKWGCSPSLRASARVSDSVKAPRPQHGGPDWERPA